MNLPQLCRSHRNLQKQPLPASHAVYLFHLVEHGKCDVLRQILYVRLTALVTLGNAACRRNDIFLKPLPPF